MAIAGVVAPAGTTTRPDVIGLVEVKSVPVPTPNMPPVVDAGPDQTIQWPTVTTTLSGSVADDSDTITHAWTVLQSVGRTIIERPDSLNTAVYLAGPGIFIFRLEASDGVQGAFDTVTITVLPAAPVNRPPVVEAGPDQTIPWDRRGAVQLAGSVSDEVAGQVLTVGWTQVSGPGAVVFANTSSPESRALITSAGEYVLRLLASDGELTASDTVTITVLPEPVPEPEMVTISVATLNETIQRLEIAISSAVAATGAVIAAMAEMRVAAETMRKWVVRP